MNKKEELYEVPLKCPSCYLNYYELRAISFEEYRNIDFKEELCSFCIHTHTKKEMALRMLQILEKTSPRDFAKIIKFVLNQVEFKEE